MDSSSVNLSHSMADEPPQLLSLFDGDSGFLGADLDGTGDSDLMGPSGIGGALSGGDPLMSLGSSSLPGMSGSGMMNQQPSSHSQGGYGDGGFGSTSLGQPGPGSYQMPQHQQGMMGGQQYPGGGASNYTSYPGGPMAKLRSDPMMGQGPPLAPRGIQQQQQQHPSPYRSAQPPGPGSMMQQGVAAGYGGGGYGMSQTSAGPRMPNPQQHMGVGGWMGNQGAPGQYGQQGHMAQQQQQQPPPQQQQQQQHMGGYGMATQQGEYPMGMMGQTGQRMGGHYPNTSSAQGQSAYCGPQGNGGHMMQGMSMPMMGMQQQQPQPHPQHPGMKPGQMYGGPGPGPRGMAPMMSGYGNAQQQQQQQPQQQMPSHSGGGPMAPHYSGDYMNPRQPMNSGGAATQNKPMRYPYPGAGQPQGPMGVPQQGGGVMGQQGMGDTSLMSHYPNHSPTNPGMPYRSPPYPAMAPQRNTTPSPRPTGTPPSLNSTHSPAGGQGGYGQSSLQQLEQLVTPPVGTMSAANPFQQVMQSQSSSPPTGSSARMPTFTSTSFQSGTETTMASGSGYPNPGMGMMSASGYPGGSMANGSMGNGPNANGPMSPNRGGMLGPVGLKALDIEIHNLSQKIQQLYNMPQSQQIQNQMVEMQEKLRTLKAKKQMILMRQQQQQQQQQMQQQQQQQQQQQHPGSQSPASQQYGGPHTPTAGQMRPHPAQGMGHPHQGQPAQMQSPQHQQPGGGMGIPQSPQCSMMQMQMQQFSPSSQPRPIATPPTPSSQPLTPLGTQGKMPGLPQAQMPQHGQLPGTPHLGMGGSGSYSQGVGSLSQPHTPISAQTTPPSLASQMQSPQQALSSSSPFSQMSPASKPLTPGQVSSPQLLSSIFQSTPSGSSVDPELPQITTSDSLPAEPDVLFDDNSQDSYKLESLFDNVESPVTQGSDQAMSQQSVPEEASRHQEKSIRIAQEAVLKAQAAGNSDIPRVVSPSLLTSFDTEVKTTEAEEEGGDKKPKRKRVRKPKGEKAPKPPKEPKENKPRPKRVRIRKKKEEKAEEEKEDGEEKVPKPEKPEKPEKVKTPKKLRLKPPSKKKKLPPATLMRKKKRKRGASSDVSDLDVTPPGSPRAPADDDSIQKRRSARNTKRRKYNDDLDLNLSEDENQDVDIEGGGPAGMKLQQENAPEEESIVVDKILGSRMRQREKEEEGDEEEDEPEEEEEFYVKYKNFSYLHCEWRTAAELQQRDKRIQMKINRYKAKQLQQNLVFISQLTMEDYFNPEYVEVDRVLEKSVAKDPVTGEEVTHYLVKWRSMAYDESTWELASDVDPAKVELFLQQRELPPPEERVQRARPLPSEWKQIKESRKYKNSNELREYQLEGVSWLTFCWYNKQNCILADEMGLGKTIQSITFLNEIFLYGIKGPFLVVAPLSTIANWQREFESWTDMNVITYHGGSLSRQMLQNYEMYYVDKDGNRIPNIWKFHALITTYETIMNDTEMMSQIEFRCAIIDEAHRLKNKNCRLMEHLRMLEIEHVVLLTGTPLQNNTEELFSLLNYLNPQKFPSAEAFKKEYGELKSESQVEGLKEILKPMMLRRLKEDVEKNLAPKEETIIEVELTNIQKKYYRAILERNVTFLARGGGSNNMPNLMNVMMELRKCCNHPYLIKGAEEKIVEDMGGRGQPAQAMQALVQSCGKMVLLDKLLPKLEQNGHRVLVFSQMIRVLDLLEEYLLCRKYKYERLDGSKRGPARQEAIDRFSKPDSDRFVFLLCTRAGGLGINLTAADTVIIYDSDWNPQNDLQAQARCHRIGQNKPVKVYRLVTRNSYEREMFDRASRKLGLDKAVLQSMGVEKQVNPNQMSKLEVEELLKKGAYGTLMDDDTAGDAFCEEDIDHILQRRTHVIQIESEGKGSTFAKASFSVSTNRTDIDINDPNFWQKWAKKNDVDLESQMSRNDLIIEVPRQRRQTARYGNEDCVVDMTELESSSSSENEEDKNQPTKRGRRKGRRGRRADGDFDGMDPEFSSAGYTRSDCFKVEKNLLVYGWGRWGDIILHGRFKRPMEAKDVHTIARAVLVYSLEYYQGDEKIKNFIWDLVRQANEGQLKNHSGLSAPVPRGRKGKKAKKDAKKFSVAAELEKGNLDIDPERILDEGYKRHLRRHSNKVLLRVRLLYYIKQEIIGDDAVKVLRGESFQDINIPPPVADGEPPTPWWDQDADKCLLIGIYKHGYEKYNMMRKDPALIFLHRCGPPDGAALLAEQNDDDDEKDDDDDLTTTKEFDEDDESMSSVPEGVKRTPKPFCYPEGGPENGKLPFPSISDMNTRVRRIIAGYQRNHKKQQLRQQQQEKKMVKRERNEALIREKEIRRVESLQRWSRREESDFYRTVSTFGVEQRECSGGKVYCWDRFRQMAKLERKSDQTMSDYFYAFYTMCMQVCGKRQNLPLPAVYVAPITEERAARCLARIDLLSRIREKVLPSHLLKERLRLCQKSSDLPPWWEPGHHDLDLLIGAARHGVCHTVYYILRDPQLSFCKQLELAQLSSQASSASPLGTSTPRADHNNLLKQETDSTSCSELTESPIKSAAPADTPVKTEAVEPKKEAAEEEEAEEEEGVAAAAAAATATASEEVAVKSEPTDPAATSPVAASPATATSPAAATSPLAATSPVKAEVEETAPGKVEKMEVDDAKPSSSPAAKSPLEMKTEAEEPMEVETSCPAEVKKEMEEEEATSEVKTEDGGASPAIVAGKMEADSAEDKKEKAVTEVKKEEGEGSLEAVTEKQEEEEAEKGGPVEEAKVAKVESEEVKVEAAERAEEEGGSAEGEGEEEEEEDVELKKELMRQTESPRPDFVKLREKPPTESGEESATPRQKSEYEILREAFPDLYRNQMDADNFEPESYMGGEIYNARHILGEAVGWPKDKVLFNRLEQIAHAVELNEWPQSRKAASGPTAFDSRSCTPVGSSTPKGENPLPDSDTGDGMLEINQVTRGEVEKDFEVHLQEGEGLKMTIHKRGRPGKRKYEIDVDQAARVQALLQQSGLQGSSQDTGSPQRMSPLPTPQQPPQLTPQPLPMPANSGLLNGSALGTMDPHLLHHQLLMEQRMVPERKRRGRRRKEDDLSELAMQQALHARSLHGMMAHMDPEARVALVNMEDGSVLKGEEAPRKKDLEAFLQEHSNYMPAHAAPLAEPEMPQNMFPFMPPEMLPTAPVVKRGRRRTRLDPRDLEADKMTGEENVSVVNKETGKKITGAKAPPLKHLAHWLEQNPTFDVEAKWSHLVRGSGMFPKEMESRLLKPSNRGRKPREREPPMATPAFSPEMAASAMVNMPFYGFNHLKVPFNHFIPPHLMMGGYGLQALGLNPMALGLEEEKKAPKRRKVDGGKGSSDGADPGVSGLPASASLPHPSFGYYNPMMLNHQLMAHAQSLRGLQAAAGLPPAMSGPFGDLAAAAAATSSPAAAPSSSSSVAPSATVVNGQVESGSEEEPKAAEEDVQDCAEDLSMKRPKQGRKRSAPPQERAVPKEQSAASEAEPVQTEATDLSMKPKPTVSAAATPSTSNKTKKFSLANSKLNINDIAAGLMKRKRSRSPSAEEEAEEAVEQGEDSGYSLEKDQASDSESGADRNCAESVQGKEVAEEEQEEKQQLSEPKEEEREAAEMEEEKVVEEKVVEEEEEKVVEDSVVEETLPQPATEAEEVEAPTDVRPAVAENAAGERTSPSPQEAS